MRDTLDFGNIVHGFATAKRGRYESWLELSYAGRALQVCQSLYIIGEAIAAKNFALAESECGEAMQNLAVLRKWTMDRNLN